MTKREWGYDSEDTWCGSEIGVLLSSDIDGLGFCGCGLPERVFVSMHRYLDSVRFYHDEMKKIDAAKLSRMGENSEESRARSKCIADTKQKHGFDEDMWLLLAYIADDKELTEHGSSVYGAWLTEKGRAWLDAADAEVARREV